MFKDLKDFPSNSILNYDICIAGTGPAGISVARKLLGTDLKIVILESGGLEPEPEYQELNEGINSSETNRNIVAKFNPTIHTLPRDNLGLAGYFDLSLGIPSFPTSTIRPN